MCRDPETATLRADAHAFILEPVAAALRVGYDGPAAGWDLARPRVAAEARVEQLSLCIRRSQCVSFPPPARRRASDCPLSVQGARRGPLREGRGVSD